MRFLSFFNRDFCRQMLHYIFIMQSAKKHCTYNDSVIVNILDYLYLSFIQGMGKAFVLLIRLTVCEQVLTGQCQ